MLINTDLWKYEGGVAPQVCLSSQYSSLTYRFLFYKERKMNKQELEEKFKMLIDLDNDNELKGEILKLGQEKYNIWGKIEGFPTSQLEYYEVYDKSKINFIKTFRGESETEFVISFDELFTDTEEWGKIQEDRIKKAKEEKKKRDIEKQAKEKKAFEDGERNLYLRLKEKYEQI
jgi:hypothetical protein